MRKWLMMILIISMVSPSAAISATKPISGKSCSKVGATQVVNDLKFTCIKSGKLLIWSKGVSSRNTSSNASVAPQPTSKANATFSRLERVWNEAQKLKASKTVPTVALDFKYSPTVNKPYAEKVLSGLVGAAQFWQDEFLPKTPMPVLVFTEKDKSWLKKQLQDLEVEPEFIDRKLQQFDEQATRTKTLMNWAGMNGANGKTWFEFSIGTDFGTSKMGPNAKAFELGNLRVGPHEYTHAAQFQVIDGPNLGFLPCWFLEGGAEFYGVILGTPDTATLKQMRQQQVWEPYYINFKGMAYEPSQGWEQFLEDNGEFSDGSKLSKECGPNGAYPVGAVATQYLYELKGNDGIVAFMKEIKTTQNWKKSLENIYGISWTRMKTEVAKYIRSIVSETPKP